MKIVFWILALGLVAAAVYLVIQFAPNFEQLIHMRPQKPPSSIEEYQGRK